MKKRKKGGKRKEKKRINDFLFTTHKNLPGKIRIAHLKNIMLLKGKWIKGVQHLQY